MEFKEYIKKLRENANLTQEKSASQIGVGITTIQNWERGSSKPEIATWNDIVKVYDISIEEFTNKVAKEISNNEDINDNVSNKYEQKYKSALPSDIDYSKIDGLEFSRKEQNAFITLALNIEFSGNPIPILLSQNIDIMDVVFMLDKFKKYGLYSSCYNYLEGDNYSVTGTISTKEVKITTKGMFVLNKIKKSNKELFNVYNLGFYDFMKICNLYDVYQFSDDKEKIFKSLVNVKEYYLDTYKDFYYNGKDIKVKRESYLKANIDTSDMSKSSYDRCQKAEEDLEDIGRDYYEVEEIESTDELYLIEKETYMKKLEFYQKHKDLVEGIAKPKEFEVKILRKAIPTDKAKMMVKLIDENSK